MVVLSGFQRYFCMQYTTVRQQGRMTAELCYQDFKDTFVCNTQPSHQASAGQRGCVIRISKILLYAIHNFRKLFASRISVVLSGFQRYFCMQYTTYTLVNAHRLRLCYQDFKDTFVCNTQQHCLVAFAL